MTTATLDRPAERTSPSSKKKMKFRLLHGDYYQHTDEQRAQMEKRPGEDEKDFENRIRSIKPQRYVSKEKLLGIMQRMGLIRNGVAHSYNQKTGELEEFNWNTYTGDIVESSVDLDAAFGLTDEHGTPMKVQECQVGEHRFTFRKFQRVGEIEERGNPYAQQPGESGIDYAARLQKLADEARMKAQAEVKNESIKVAEVLGGIEGTNAAPASEMLPPSAGLAKPLEQMSDDELAQLAAEEEIVFGKGWDRKQKIRAIKDAGKGK